MRYRAFAVLAAAAALAACDDPTGSDAAASAPGITAPTGPRFSGGVAPDPVPRFYAGSDYWLGWVYRRAFTTIDPVSADSVNAFLRIADSKASFWNAFYDGAVDDSLKTWAQDARLNLSPNLVAAILVVESGMQPHVWEPGGQTYGYAQMGPSSDGGLIQHINHHTGFTWMKRGVHPDSIAVNGYSRSPSSPIDSTTLSQWYLADPMKTTRALVYHLRQIENIWTGVHKVSWDSRRAWWRDMTSINDPAHAAFKADTSYAELAARVYGRTPNAGELLDLVAASYNRGYPWVEKQLILYGTGWTAQLKSAMLGGPCLSPPPRDDAAIRREAGCYLDRVRHYTILFQAGAVFTSSAREVIESFNAGMPSNWFTYQGPGSTVTRSVPPASESYRGTAVDDNGLGLRVDYSIAAGSWGGAGLWYSAGQNWRTRAGIGSTEGLGFWYYGNGRDLNGGVGV
ncbi:MAG TPA: hypothetical protein VFQ45_08875, partial [Longimicrobium sp.]|nr:hypothetical protein [Longimicrobium sp.]